MCPKKIDSTKTNSNYWNWSESESVIHSYKDFNCDQNLKQPYFPLNGSVG